MAILDKGLYAGTVKDWGLGESNKGKPAFELKVSLTNKANDDGKDGDELESPIGRTITIYLTPAAMEIASANLRSLGVLDTDTASLKRLHRDHPEAHDFTGQRVLVDVTHETYNGRPVERVQLRRESSKIKRLDLNDLSIFDDLDSMFKEEQKKHVKVDGGEASGKKAKGKK